MAYIYDIADVWAASGTTFTGIKLNVTDTASAAGSLLMDLQVGGSSRFSVGKGGAITAQGATTNDIAVFGFRTSTSIAEIYLASNSGGGKFYATANEGSNLGRVVLASTGQYTFSPNANLNSGTTVDLILARDAANTLAQRNGVNAQAFNLYQSYTDASNYTRGRVAAASGIVTIAGESAGTGATDIDIALTPKGTGRVRYGTHAAIAAETVTGYIEIKDAGGTVRKIAVVS